MGEEGGESPVEAERRINRVLVVAADREIQRMLSSQLIRAGYLVYGATNGYDALKQMERHPVDLVLTDYQMPVIGGLPFLSISRLRWPGTPVVVLCEEGSDMAQVQAVEEGAVAWIRKGCDSSTLLDVVALAIPQSAHF
jgi:two-component system chemotaxis response regulator CheY